MCTCSIVCLDSKGSIACLDILTSKWFIIDLSYLHMYTPHVSGEYFVTNGPFPAMFT